MLEGNEDKFYDDLIRSVGTYEVQKLTCNHKHDEKIAVVPLSNGKVRCDSCGKEFHIVDGDKDVIEQVIQNVCDSVNDIVQTIKFVGDEKENKELYQFEFTLHKLLELYIKAKSEFEARVKNHNDNSFPISDYTETMFRNSMKFSEAIKEEK